MFKVLVVDDNSEERELLMKEIEHALGNDEDDLRFYEARSVKKALDVLKSQMFDLMTLDIEFDRMNEGIDALPEFFELYPTLNIVVVSGKLNKTEVSERLFRFTRDNVLKGKRWARHFDVLDKKDDKAEALRRAHSFAAGGREEQGQLRELFSEAEALLERGEFEKCLEVYKKIQSLAPGELESRENIGLFERGSSVEQARKYMKKGERVVAALLLGHHLEVRLKAFTKKVLGRYQPALHDCLKELERSRRLGSLKKSLFQKILRLRNKAIHHPATFNEEDFETSLKHLGLLEAKF